MKKKFSKRTFENARHFMKELRFTLSHLKAVRQYNKSGLIDFALRERIMMMVTSVNRCRYCSFVHSKLALNNGFESEEVSGLLGGSIDVSNPEHAEILLYCQHLAETRNSPDENIQKKLLKNHSFELITAVETVARMIYFGNLLGNSFDALLYKLSFGKLGNA